MDLGALIAKLLLDASDWTAGIDTALAGLDVLTSAAQAAGAASAVALSAAVVAGVESASSFQQAAMSMEVMLGSAEAAQTMMTNIRDMAAVTPFDTQNLTEGAQQLIATGFAAENVLPVLTALGDAASSMPNGMAQKLPRMIQAFGKINSAGKVSLGALNQFKNAGINAVGMLADYMSVSVPEAYKQISKGAVTSAVGLNAIMLGIQEKYGGMMERQSKTLAGVWSTLTDSIKVPLSKMAQPLVEALSKAIPAISAILPGLLSGLKPIFDGLAKAADAVGYLAVAFGQLSAPMQMVISYGVAGFMALTIVMGVAAVAVTAVIAPLLGLASSLLTAAASVFALDIAFGPALVIVAAFAGTLVWAGIVAGTMAASFLSMATMVTGAIGAIYELWANDFGGMQEVAGALWAIMGAGVSVIQGIGTAIAGAATEWLTSMGVIGDSTGTTFGSIKEAIVSGISSAVTAASGFIEDLRQSFLDMADSVILTLLRIAVAMGKLPGMEGAAAGGIAGLLQAQSGISQARGQTANIAALEFKLPDLSGWVDEAKAGLTDYGKTLASMLGGEAPTGGGSAAKASKASADDYEAIHAAAIEAEQGLLNMSAAMQAQAYQKGFDDMNAAAMATGATLNELDGMYAEALKAVIEFRKGLLDTVLSASGDAGNVIKSAIEGFGTGGIKGALAAVAVQLLTIAPGFQKLVDGINSQLVSMLGALDPLFSGLGAILIPAMQAVATVFASLAPIFQFIGNVLSGVGPIVLMVATMMQSFGVIFQIFGNVLNAIGPIVEFAFQVLFTVMKGVAFVVLGIAYAIGSVWNGILNIIITVLEVISKVTNKVDGAIAALEDMKVDTAGTAEAMQTLAGTTYESAYATAQASAQTAMMADAATEATAALSNVPSGFKVALSRFEAMATEGVAQSKAASNASSQRRGEGGITINIAAITAADPADLFDRLENEAKKRRYRKTGISIPTAPRFILGS